MLEYPSVIVHGLAEADRALAPGRPVTLLSARGAALYAGCGWWRALAAAARSRHRRTPMRDALDCADAPGHALEALRLGQTLLVLDGTSPAWALVAARAATIGATLLPDAPPALDLGQPGAERRLSAWLSQA